MQKMLVGVIVTYEPNVGALRELLEALRPQVADIVVVDNGSKIDVAQHVRNWGGKIATCLALLSNLGIAAAQNKGVLWAKARGASHVIFFDQDSRPSVNMVETLLAAHSAKEAEGHKIAAVGPRYVDSRRYIPPPFLRVRGLRLQRSDCAYENITEVDYLISSGSLISTATLNAVGGMAEPLFIDYVDIEWGLRARQFGFECFGVCNATMEHTLGEEPARFFGFRFPVHSPLRHYYHFRNAVYMYWWMTLPRNWKIVDGSRLVLKYLFYSFVTKPRRKHCFYMTKGIWDGLRGHMGKLET